MIAFYEPFGQATESPQQHLARHATALGLTFLAKPTLSDAMLRTEMAWMRDGTSRAETAAAKRKLPWIVWGSHAGRDVAVFMVKGAPGSVIAARTHASGPGPVVRVYNRYGMTTWTSAISFTCSPVVGGAAAWFLHTRGWEIAAGVVWWLSALLCFAGIRHLLSLMGILRLRSPCGSIPIGEGEFAKRYAVVCTDPAHASRILSPQIQRLMVEDGPHGAAWWSIGSGWVSCVSRYEQINRTHGKVVTVDALRYSVDLVARIAGAIELPAG